MSQSKPTDLLAADYVLGLLDAAAQAAADRRMSGDPLFAREVEKWRERLADFDRSAETIPPSPAMWQSIENSLQSAAPRQTKPARSGLWQSLALWRGAAFAGIAATLLLAVALASALREAQRTPAMVAVLLDGDRAGAVVHVFADGRAVLQPLTDIPVPSDRDLQVWTLPSRERGPVSIGLMQQARTLSLALGNLPNTRTEQLFEITLEPKGGSPIGRPTGPILYKGLTSRAL